MGSLCYLCLGVLALTWSVSSQPQLVAYPNYQPNSGSNPFPLGPVCDDELDLVIAFDGSNSMYERDFTLQKNAIINLVNNLNIGPLDVHVGLVLFSTDVYSHPLSGNKQQIIADINALEYPDDLTRTDLAIQRATELFRRNSRGGLVRKILVIVTDGRSNKPDLTIQEADIAKASGISISVIGVTDAIYQPELDAIASSPQQVFSSATFQNLQREILHAVYRSCQIGVLYCQSNPCVNGRCVETGRGYTCDCTGTIYTGFRCDKTACTEKAFNPCLNNGMCLPLSNTAFTCNCANGFTGRLCENAIINRSFNCTEFPCPADVPRFNYPAWDDASSQGYFNCEYGVLERKTCDPGYKFDLISLNCKKDTEKFLITTSNYYKPGTF